MNAVQRAVVGTMQGNILPDNWELAAGIGLPPAWPSSSSSGHSTANAITGVANAVAISLASIFGRNQGASAQNQIPPGYGYNQQGQLVPVSPNGAGVGIGIDGQGIRLSDGSHIGWFPIAGVTLAIFLLQSKGFSRR